jgi:Na+/H+-dicarboxylate symporter
MLVLGVDRILDMARTTLNVAADLVTVCIADRVVGPGRVAGETQTAGEG